MKLRLCLFAFATFAFAGCSGGGGNSTPAANNPSSIVVTTDVQGVATSGITVALSTSLVDGVPPSGSVIQSLVSGSDGTTGEITFSTGIPTTGKLCLSSTYVVGTQSQTLASCHSQPHPASATINFTI